MLSEREIATLTLRAPYIHEHGDRPYFMHEINSVAQQLKEPSYLNFFVRYRSEKADASKHRWSRVVKVVFLEECGKAVGNDNDNASHPFPSNNNGTEEAAAGGTARGSGSGRPTLTIQTDLTDNSTSGRKANAAGNTVVWRNKLFWIALMVVGEENPVHLPRISHKLPTEEEVMQFCAYQSLTNPEETFSTVDPVGVATTTATTAAAVDEQEHDSERDNSNHHREDSLGEAQERSRSRSRSRSEHEGEGEGDGYFQPATTTTTTVVTVDPNAIARTYLPTREQLLKLRDFRDERITRHTWTVEETEEAAQLHAKYGDRSAGAAAAPMAATANKVRTLQLQSRLLNQQQQQQQQQAPTHNSDSQAAAAFTQSQSLLAHTQEASSSFLSSPPQSPASPSQLAGGATAPSPTTKRNLRGQAVYTGRSPFLPKRLRQRDGDGASGGGGGSTFTPTASQSSLTGGSHHHNNNSESQLSLSGAPLSAFDEATPASQLLPPITTHTTATPSSLFPLRQQPSSQPIIDSHTVESWEQEYEHQIEFYRYITDRQRSGYINKIADITRRNALRNRMNSLAGIEFAKKMERQANFVESGGLWVTDDKLRAEKAAQYKAAQESESTGKKEERAEKPPAANAAAAGGGGGGRGGGGGGGTAEAGGGDGTGGAEVDPKESKEREERRQREGKLLDAFKAKHTAQELRFDAVPEDWFTDDTLFSSSSSTEGGWSLSLSSVPFVASPSPNRLLVPRVSGGETEDAEGEDASKEKKSGGSGDGSHKASTHSRSTPSVPSVSVAAQVITSQLLHRSAWSMARGGGGGGGGSTARDPAAIAATDAVVAEPAAKKARTV